MFSVEREREGERADTDLELVFLFSVVVLLVLARWFLHSFAMGVKSLHGAHPK